MAKKLLTHYVDSKMVYDPKAKDCFFCRNFNDCKELKDFDEKYKDESEEIREGAFNKIMTNQCKLGSFLKKENEDGTLFSSRSGRKTSMTPQNLPEFFFRGYWGCGWHYISTKSVIDIKYSWVKENHIFKDSCLYVSRENINDTDDYEKWSEIIYGNDIIPFLKMLLIYSPDIANKVEKIKKEIIKQLDWLLLNEKDFMHEYIEKGYNGTNLFEYFYNKLY